jgi:UDP-N-acetylmuramoyl-L-alanyl-D-glutamate--2,6-diaminopimelate ligase
MKASLRTLFAGYGVAAPDLVVSGLALDSRYVNPGDLFLAVRGSAAHGLTHLSQAIERGAAAVAWEPMAGVPTPDCDIAEFAVPELGIRAGEIAARFYGEPSKRAFVFGVTGTDGKTSCAHLVAQAFDRLGRDAAYLGTIGYGRLAALATASHTTPDAVTLQGWLARMVDDGCTAVSMEVSSHALDQQRVAGTSFDAVALTNLQRDHLDYHGTLERYAAAKRKLFEPADGRALILNRDDAAGALWLEQLAASESARAHCMAYGLDGDMPATARYVIGRELSLQGDGLSLMLDTHEGRAQLSTRLLGRFNAYNLMVAAAVLFAAGYALPQIVEALSQSHTVPGRIEGFRGPRAAPLVVVDYAHTPQALEQILRAVRAHTRGRLVCVFGCGGDRDRGKRPLMGAAAQRYADVAIVTDDNPRSEDPAAIIADIAVGMTAAPLRVIHDRALAIQAAVAEASADDVVVIAGKGHEDYQLYGRERRDFSDRAFVAELVGGRA